MHCLDRHKTLSTLQGKGREGENCGMWCRVSRLCGSKEKAAGQSQGLCGKEGDHLSADHSYDEDHRSPGPQLLHLVLQVPMSQQQR